MNNKKQYKEALITITFLTNKDIIITSEYSKDYLGMGENEVE